MVRGLGIGRSRGTRAWISTLTALGLGMAVTGCLGKPEIEDRWTRIDIAESSVAPYQIVAAGSSQPITVRAAVTYRSILTGFAVAELRASTISPASVEVEPKAVRTRMADDIDRILANSVTLGRATRAVTGWDHLIQHIDFTFDGNIPAYADSSSSPTGLFLVCYLGEGDEIEREDGSDSLIVTPFNSTQYQILPVGMELNVTTGGN
jgi:hypothetical protein